MFYTSKNYITIILASKRTENLQEGGVAFKSLYRDSVKAKTVAYVKILIL